MCDFTAEMHHQLHTFALVRIRVTGFCFCDKSQSYSGTSLAECTKLYSVLVSPPLWWSLQPCSRTELPEGWNRSLTAPSSCPVDNRAVCELRSPRTCIVISSLFTWCVFLFVIIKGKKSACYIVRHCLLPQWKLSELLRHNCFVFFPLHFQILSSCACACVEEEAGGYLW